MWLAPAPASARRARTRCRPAVPNLTAAPARGRTGWTGRTTRSASATPDNWSHAGITRPRAQHLAATVAAATATGVGWTFTAPAGHDDQRLHASGGPSARQGSSDGATSGLHAYRSSEDVARFDYAAPWLMSAAMQPCFGPVPGAGNPVRLTRTPIVSRGPSVRAQAPAFVTHGMLCRKRPARRSMPRQGASRSTQHGSISPTRIAPLIAIAPTGPLLDTSHAAGR